MPITGKDITSIKYADQKWSFSPFAGKDLSKIPTWIAKTKYNTKPPKKRDQKTITTVAITNNTSVRQMAFNIVAAYDETKKGLFVEIPIMTKCLNTYHVACLTMKVKMRNNLEKVHKDLLAARKKVLNDGCTFCFSKAKIIMRENFKIIE